MFDFSWSELVLVAIIGLLVIGPEELPDLIKNVKSIFNKIKSIGNDFASDIMNDNNMTDLKSEAKKLNNDIKTIVDLDGNEQPTYDLSDIMDDIEKNKKE